MIVLKRVRPGRGRHANPTDRRSYRRRSYHRRNPDIAGTPVGDVVAVIGGGWGTYQIASLASGVAAPLTGWIDKIRAGMGQAALEAVAAIGVGMGVRRFLGSHYGNVTRLGGLAVAGAQAGAAITGENLLQGQPALVSGGQFTLLQGGKTTDAASKAANSTPALPSVESQM